MMRNGGLALASALLLASCATAGTQTASPAVSQPLPPQLAGIYDAQNPFAKILRGELPVAKVYEDQYVLAFMDHRPLAPGHVLVISKTSKARNLLEIDPVDLARVMAVAKLVTRAEFTALGATGVTLEQNNGSAQSVFHLHVHVIPRYNGASSGGEQGPIVPVADLQPVANKLAAAIAKP
jgi:histidine triad (HIT) family protein